MQQLSLWHFEQPCLPGIGGPNVTRSPKQRCDSLGLLVWFERSFAMKVDLRFHTSSKTTVYYRLGKEQLALRLHRLFLCAPVTILQAVVRFVQGDRHAGVLLDAFIARHLPDTELLPLTRMQRRGKYHDLGKLLRQTNMLYFHGAGTDNITWGKAEKRVLPRLHRLAIYLVKIRLIVVHPCLDHGDVPLYVLQWLLYKTLLYELFEIDGKQIEHRSSLREIDILETCHPEFMRASSWLVGNKHALRQHHQQPSLKSCGLRRIGKQLPRIG